MCIHWRNKRKFKPVDSCGEMSLLALIGRHSKKAERAKNFGDIKIFNRHNKIVENLEERLLAKTRSIN
ncbi:MAG: hypothetical protein KAS01_02270 [Candidatus Pacebacteria bacterium]|nr:hypothetical protein [Candidatus Paceibacterota bacterium]